MDEPIDKAKLAAVLAGKDGSPELADLPAWWDRTPPEARLPDGRLARDALLSSYSNWAFTKLWAWEGLERLLSILLERREPIPPTLALWAYTAASRQRKPPDRRGRPDEAERNARIVHALGVLRHEHGYKREPAMKEIAGALVVSFDAVRSAVRTVEKAEPFPRTG